MSGLLNKLTHHGKNSNSSNQDQNQQGGLDEWYQLTPARGGSIRLLISASGGLNSGFLQGVGLNQGIGSGFNQGIGSGFNQGIGSGLNQGIGSGFNQGIGSGFNQGLTQGTPTETIVAQTVQETVVLPTIVQEVIRTDRVIEVQPVITRHVEQPHVHHVEKHVFQAAAPPVASNVVNAPIINETLHPHIINEVQEVLHKEIAVVQVEHAQQLTEEHVVLPTQHSHEVIQDVLITGASNLSLNSSGQGLNRSNSAGQSGIGQQGFNQGAQVNQGLSGAQLNQGSQAGLQGGRAEIPRASKEAQALESLASVQDRRGIQAGAPAVDPLTGELVQPRTTKSAARTEEKAAQVEANYDAKQQGAGKARFIA